MGVDTRCATFSFLFRFFFSFSSVKERDEVFVKILGHFASSRCSRPFVLKERRNFVFLSKLNIFV